MSKVIRHRIFTVLKTLMHVGVCLLIGFLALVFYWKYTAKLHRKPIRIELCSGTESVKINNKKVSVVELAQYLKERPYSQNAVVVCDEECPLKLFFPVRDLCAGYGLGRVSLEVNGVLSPEMAVPCWGHGEFTNEVCLEITEYHFRIYEFEGNAVRPIGFFSEPKLIEEECSYTSGYKNFDNEKDFLNAVEALSIDDTTVVVIKCSLYIKLAPLIKVLSCSSIRNAGVRTVWVM